MRLALKLPFLFEKFFANHSCLIYEDCENEAPQNEPGEYPRLNGDPKVWVQIVDTPWLQNDENCNGLHDIRTRKEGDRNNLTLHEVR